MHNILKKARAKLSWLKVNRPHSVWGVSTSCQTQTHKHIVHTHAYTYAYTHTLHMHTHIQCTVIHTHAHRHTQEASGILQPHFQNAIVLCSLRPPWKATASFCWKPAIVSTGPGRQRRPFCTPPVLNTLKLRTLVATATQPFPWVTACKGMQHSHCNKPVNVQVQRLSIQKTVTVHIILHHSVPVYVPVYP